MRLPNSNNGRKLRPAIPAPRPSAPQRPREEGETLPVAEVLEAGTSSLARAVADAENPGDIDYEALEAAYKATLATLVAQEAAAPEAETGRTFQSHDDTHEELSPAELTQKVDAIEFAGLPRLELTRDDLDAEEVSILVQYLYLCSGGDKEQQALDRLESLRRRGSVTSLVTQILVSICCLAETAPFDRFDPFISKFVPLLRRLGARLDECLPEFAVTLSQRGREALWPHAMNDLLLFVKGRKKGLDARIDGLDPEARRRAIRRLGALDTIGRRRLDPAAFELHQTFLHGVFSELLVTPAAAVVGPVVLAALRRTVPAEEWLANIIRAHAEYHSDIDGFLQFALVGESAHRLDDGQAFERASDLLVDKLVRMPDNLREVPWIPKALEWMGRHGTLKSFDFLEQVCKEKRGLFKHVWSAECRAAAKAGIQQGWCGDADA